jgi:hypothetical protein
MVVAEGAEIIRIGENVTPPQKAAKEATERSK